MESSSKPWQLLIEKSSDFLPVLWHHGQNLTDVEFRFKSGKRKASGGAADPLMGHSMVLMALSPKFYAQLETTEQRSKRNHTSQSSAGPLVLNAPDGISREAFQFFLEYIYFVKMGEDVTEAVAKGLLLLAKEYENGRLARDLEHFYMRTLNQTNLPTHYDIGRTFNFQSLVLRCLEMVSYSKTLFQESSLWKSISKDLMNDILVMEQLPISEEDLFLFFHRWCSEVVRPEELESTKAHLKHHIRFPTMPVDYLASDVEKSGVLTQEELLNCAFDAACSPSAPRRSSFSSRKRKTVEVIEATSTKLGRFTVMKEAGMILKNLKSKFALALGVSPDVVMFEFNMKDGAFRELCNAGHSQGQINVDEISCDLLETGTLKIIIMIAVVAFSSVGEKMTLHIDPEAPVLKLATQLVAEVKKRTGDEVAPEAVQFVTSSGQDVTDTKQNLETAGIKDGDIIRYNILKMKTDRISFFVTDMTGDRTTFKMKRSTPLKKLKGAYAEKYNIREDEKQHCRFLYDGNRINDDDTPFSLGMDDSDTIEFFWAHDFDFGQRKKNLESQDRRELELE